MVGSDKDAYRNLRKGLLLKAKKSRWWFNNRNYHVWDWGSHR